MSEIIAVKGALLIASALCFYWGLRIIFSDRYFSHWQDAHWKETNDGQWSGGSVKFNRYGRSLRAIGVGLAMLYIVFFL